MSKRSDNSSLDPILRSRLGKGLVALAALTASVVAAAILVAMLGDSPAGAVSTVARSAFSCSSASDCALLTTLERATPLILTGLSAVVAFRAGMFSIGQEGQLLVGMGLAGYFATVIPGPAVTTWIGVGLIGAIGGGLWGLLAGWLKVRYGVNEVISTVVLNEIALLILIYFVIGPLKAPGGTTAYTESIPDSARLPIWGSGSKFGLGFAVAIVAAILVWAYLFRSRGGFAVRTVGQAPRYARYLGLKSDRVVLRAMFMSGALSGIAGVIEVLGVNYKVSQGPSQNLGFDGLGVAILGLVHPIGVVVVGILFAGVRLGTQIGLQIELSIPREIGGIMIALTMMFVAVGQSFEGQAGRLVDRADRFRRRVRLLRRRGPGEVL